MATDAADEPWIDNEVQQEQLCIEDRFRQNSEEFTSGIEEMAASIHDLQSMIEQLRAEQSSMKQPQSKQIQPVLFAGEVPLQEYMSQFDAVAAWNGWTERQKAHQLYMCLRGRARF